MKNVVWGDVWVCGQKQNQGVPIPAQELTAISATVRGHLRFLSARTLNWTNVSQAVSGEWREWDASPETLACLASVTCYFGKNLAAHPDSVPIGLITVPWEETLTEDFTSLSKITDASDLKPARDAVLQAGRQATQDCAPALEQFKKDILQLKREGKILNPPAEKPDPPAWIHVGNFRFVPLATRAGIR